MKLQTILSQTVKVLPDLVTTYSKLIAKNLTENTQDILDTSTGTVGILLKIFGKPLLDSYEQKKSIEKLANFGLETYFESAQVQISKSIEAIDKLQEANYTAEKVIDVFNALNAETLKTISTDELVMVFQPKYHPVIQIVRKNQENLFRSLGIEELVIKEFTKDFNTHIGETVKATFGKDYEAHQKQIEVYINNEAEVNLLMTMIEANKIGFDTNEKMGYEETFGEWKPTHCVNWQDQEREDTDKESEKALRPVKQLIEDFFEQGTKEALERILFVIADFGKGKTVFMKHYAALLAREYIDTQEGYFPIYFNLREYEHYKSDEKLGVIANYLRKSYSFNIEEHNHQYIFLIDSLDESGELNKPAIDAVIASVKKIQNIDETKHRNNRILITSRPISGCLQEHLEKHHPHCIKSEDKKDIQHYISIYGFKQEQFNNWLMQSLKNNSSCPTTSDVAFVEKILRGIEKGETVDIYSKLLEDESLTRSELQRPIFAYMIYQLIINKIDFLKVGKIGIYLSFINFLSKDAKHVNDPSHKVMLLDELGFRNLLQATGALWMQERHKGKQASLNKADICRVLNPKDKDKEDKDLLANSDITDIQFLSHSYFGEKDNTLHFQHQSFAEILLAEYYLKVIIKYALEKKANIHEARAKLMLGTPTEQSVLFFRDLLTLLKDTASEKATDEVLEKRKLLFPLMASLAIEKNNTLFSSELYYTWLNTHPIESHDTEYSQDLLAKWCINKIHIDKILELAKDIVNAEDSFVLAEAEVKTNLIRAEVLLFANRGLYANSKSMDKWLALLVGNTLYNDISDAEQPVLFNTKYQISYTQLFALLEERQPFVFMGRLFMGIDMKENENTIFIEWDLNNVDFSYSILENVAFSGWLSQVRFRYSKMESIDFYSYSINFIDFSKSELINICFLGSKSHNCDFSQITKNSSVNFYRTLYESVLLNNTPILFEKVSKYLENYGKIFIPYRLLSKETANYAENIGYTNSIIQLFRTLGKLANKQEAFYTRELPKVLLFQDTKTKKIFSQALAKNWCIEDIVQEMEQIVE